MVLIDGKELKLSVCRMTMTMKRDMTLINIVMEGNHVYNSSGDTYKVHTLGNYKDSEN